MYTARGSQGFGVGSFISRQIGLFDEKSLENQAFNTFIYTLKYDKKRVYYKSRNIFNAKQAPSFTMTDRRKSSAAGENSFYSAITSFPMYAKYGNLDSVRFTEFERLIVLMKDP